MRKVTPQIKEKMIFLRQQGYSVPEISKYVSISKSTVLRYIKNVQILPEYLTQWAGKRGGSRKRKLIKESQAFEEGKNLVGQLSKKEKLLVLASLYWAEGTKKDFSLANTDPNLVYVFVKCMRDIFGLKDEDFYINVRLYEDLDREKSLEFWSKVVKIPKSNLKGVNILVGKKKGKLEYGMCRVRVAKGGDLLKKIKGINRALFENLSL